MLNLMGLLGAAKKAGKKIYHGTADLFDDFDVSKSADGSIWFTDNKSKILSGDVGASTSGNVMERIIDEDKLKLATWDDIDKYSTDQLINQGFDGVKMVDDDEITYQIFSPEKLSKVESLNKPQGLPMDTPSRMARAKEQGFNVDDVTYRWLSEDYPENKMPVNSRYKFGDAIYSSPDPSYGQAYANELSDSPVVYPMISKGKIASKGDAVNAEKVLRDQGLMPKDYTQRMNAINKQLKADGFTGLDFAGERMMFDENTSRSVFAAFDPAKKDSSNILASKPSATIGAGLLGAGALTGSEEADAGALGKTSGLLMDTASRMARAKEQGFDVDTPYYHGTNVEFDSFDADLGNQRDVGFYGSGNYFSPDQDVAEEYAVSLVDDTGVGDVNVVEAMLNYKKPFIWDKENPDALLSLLKDAGVRSPYVDNIANATDLRAFDKYLKDNGHDAVIVKNMFGNIDEVMVPNSSQIRSPDAQFNPAKTGSSNLLASNPVATAGAGILGLGAATQSNDTYADYSPSNLARLRNDDVGGYQAPRSEMGARAASLLADANKRGSDDPLLGLLAPELPAELLNKMAYDDERGLTDYAKAYFGLLGF